MLFKLSVRNIKKSFHDYLIYFATLILGVAIFYVFNSLESQTIMLRVSSDTREIITFMMDGMAAVSVFVSFVLGFLIVYASNFLMKRRKKEFGVYMLLGMSKRKISGILIIETIMIGLISLGIGLVVGIAASQGMSIVVANLFEADMTGFHFVISSEAIVKTVVYFMVIYVVVILLDAFVVGKAKLINLINAGKQSQKNHAKNPIVCAIVFVVACILLGSAYYNVTAGLAQISELAGIAIQIAKGIIGTFMIFWSVSGMLITLAKKNKRFYYKGLNCFSTKELSSRINTTVFSGGIICLLLFFTICILSCAVAIKKSTDDVLAKKIPMDAQFIVWQDESDKEVIEHLADMGIDTNQFCDEVEVTTYKSKNLNELTLVHDVLDELGYSEDDDTSYMEEMFIDAIRISDYNRLAQAFGMPQYSLEEGEYIMIADFDYAVQIYNVALAADTVIDINGKEYAPKYAECKDGFVLMSNAADNTGIIIVPDSVDLTGFSFTKYLTVNYNVKGEDKEDELDEFFDGSDFLKMNDAYEQDGGAYISVNTKSYLYNGTVGMTAMIIFIGIYLGIVFLISGAAILSLKELSEAADNKEKYMVLRKLGVDEKQISKSLASQCGIFFGLPLGLAIIHSIFGMQTASFVLSAFGNTGLIPSIIMAAVVILGIYGIYFWITYACSRKIISE